MEEVNFSKLVKSKLNLSIVENITVKPSELVSIDRPSRITVDACAYQKEYPQAFDELVEIIAQELGFEITRNVISSMRNNAQQIVINYIPEKTVKENADSFRNRVNSFDYDFIVTGAEMRPFLDENFFESKESDVKSIHINKSETKDGKVVYFDPLFPVMSVLLGKKQDCEYELIDPLVPNGFNEEKSSESFKTIECHKVHSPNSYVLVKLAIAFTDRTI